MNLKVDEIINDLKNIKIIKFEENSYLNKKSSISLDDNISTVESSKSINLEKITGKSNKKNRNFMEIKNSFNLSKVIESDDKSTSDSLSNSLPRKINLGEMMKKNKNAISSENKLTELYEEIKEKYNEYINKKKVKMLQIANNNLINCKQEMNKKKCLIKKKQGKINYNYKYIL